MLSKTLSVSMIVLLCTVGFVRTEKAVSSDTKEIDNIEMINVTFESNNYTLYGEIYYPSEVSGTYSGIVFCEGLGAYVSAYSWIPKALAKEGYVVIIYDPPGQGKSDGISPGGGVSFPILNLYFRFGTILETSYHYLNHDCVDALEDALTYLLNESPVKDIVNKTSIGFIGHSLGGITVTDAAAQDSRVKAVIALSHGNCLLIDKINVPIQFQGGGFDLPLFSVPIMLRCYSKANTPKELVMIKHGTHIGFTTAFGPLCLCPRWQKDIIVHYAVGWFDYFLKNKSEGYDTITSGVDHLSKIFRSRYNFGDGEHLLN